MAETPERRPEHHPENRTDERQSSSGPVERAAQFTAPATPGARQRAAEPPRILPQNVPRILCVDDEPAILKILTRALEGNFEIVTANDPRKALMLLEHGMDFSVVISDMKMPQMDGAEFLAQVARIAPMSTRLALTACLERELTPEEAFGILTKPCPLNLLQASVQAAVDHHMMQSIVRPRIQPVPLPGLPPRRQPTVPGLRASVQDADLTLLLPHLAFDSSSRSSHPIESEAPRLSALAGVAEKFFRLGNATEAERILRPALWDLLTRCESARRAPERQVELAAKLALRLAEDTHSAHWIDYVFRVFTGMSRPLSTDLIEQLHELLRRVPGANRSAYQRYLMALRACRHEFGPSDHFLVRRIEGLEPLISP